jgi:hypothetical protein
MSKLFKSKFLLGVMVVAVLVAGGVALNANSASADCATTITMTLRVGSSGVQVQCVQTIVGATADGAFGPLTKAAVMAWQAGHGLVADGVVGPMTRAAMMGAPMSGAYPAGCTSTAGFSPTTGMPCNSGTSSGLPAGCMSTVGYSPTTGAKCDGASTPSTGGPLAGGAGDITVTELSSPSSSTKVGEGENDVKVLGIEVEADADSDVEINSMRLTLEHTSGTGNDRLDRYAEEVSIWMGSTRVGSADVSEFSESSGVYSKSIALSGAIVRADQTANFYVSVDAVNNIDSGDTGSANNTWTTTLTSTRFMDATGVVLTDSTASIANTHVYDTLSATGDVELRVALSSSTPTAQTVKASTTANTNQVELLRFTMKAQNSAMYVDQVPVSFTTSGTLNEVTGNVTLVIDGQTFNEAVTDVASSATISFNNLGLNLDENETVTGVVYADINDIESPTFTEGTTLLASLTSTLVAATGSSAGALDAEDKNGDQLVAGDRSGSAVGNLMTFRSEGVNVVMGTSTYANTTDTNGLVTSVTYTIPVAVTSFGDTLYLGQSAQLATAVTASNAFALVVETSDAPTTGTTSATTSITLSTSNATIESNGYRLDDGQTKNFTVTVHMTAGTDDMSHRFRIDEVQTFTEAGLVTGTSSDLLPVENYRTGFQYINN